MEHKKNNTARLRKIKRFNNKKYKEYTKLSRRKHIDPSQYLTQMKSPDNILEVENLCTYFYTDVGTVKAVDGVTFDVPKGKTVGIVGESGCGKSVMSLSVMRLLQEPQGQIASGEIRFRQSSENRAVNIPKLP